MPDLILHIGFPKCASTSLQNQVFKGEKGALGTYRGLHKSSNYAKQFKACTPVGPRQWADYSGIRKWVKQVRADHGPDIERFLLSDEMLTNTNKRLNRPIIPFLKKFSDTIWTDGKVKVVLILRNYAERMASGYVQVSSVNPLASQANFEKHVATMLQKGSARDYGSWVVELRDVLGKDNVCVLLMEEIGQIHFWKELQAFCQLEYFEPDTMLINTQNSKRKGKDAWAIQAYDPAKKARTMANNIIGFGWPYHLANQQRARALEWSKRKLTAYYARKYSATNQDRAQEIWLHADLRAHIQASYQSSTARLSKLLGKDMAALGY